MRPEHERLRVSALDNLTNIQARLYCLALALAQSGEKSLGIVAEGISADLDETVACEKEFNSQVKEEMLKFSQGFSYRPRHVREDNELEFEED